MEMSQHFSRRTLVAGGLGAMAIGATAFPSIASADQHGTAPTAASIIADGPYAYATKNVARPSNQSFGGGTLYYPSKPAAGEKFGALVVVPGFTGVKQNFAAYGKRLASHGFVTMVIDTFTPLDTPEIRALQVNAAMKHLLANQDVAGIIDPTRTGVIGHSMGGGGVLTAAQATRYKAVVALNPWCDSQKAFPLVKAPTLIVGSMWDTIAPNEQHSALFYASLGSSQKAYLYDLIGTHLTVYGKDNIIMARVLSFVKVFVDGDERYRKLLCGQVAASTYKSTFC